MASDEEKEILYEQGHKMAWRMMLQQCCKALGYDEDREAKHAAWILEREDAILSLRSLCEQFGDNDWHQNLHLSDIIDKHLLNYLLDISDQMEGLRERLLEK